MLDHIEHRLNLLELKCRRPVEHVLAGEYQSVFRGHGLEFEDVRAYQYGDDVRAMDWKVTARTGNPHIKRYIEEREQVVYLLVDVSASMRHDNSGNKRETLNELCALITLAAIKNQDAAKTQGMFFSKKETSRTILEVPHATPDVLQTN